MLPKINRIAKKKEFDRFFGPAFKKVNGRNFSGPAFILKIYQTATVLGRAGIIVSNKIDNRAVVRNRIKRQVREELRACLPKMNNKQILVVAQPAAKAMENPQLRADLKNLFRKAGLC